MDIRRQIIDYTGRLPRQDELRPGMARGKLRRLAVTIA
jgi:hypothetical protein